MTPALAQREAALAAVAVLALVVALAIGAATGRSEDEAAFPYSTASWFFLDAVEMTAPAASFAIVAFGDSITDGTASTMNGGQVAG